MSHPFDDGVPRRYGLYSAIVIDNKDPLGRWRVRMDIDSVTKKSAWAPPLGTIGGGGPQRGGFVVPEIGADVEVLFLNGDIERPRYFCGAWSSPSSGSEMPVPTRDVPPAEAHLVPSLQLCGGRLSIYVDERAGKRKLVFEDNELGDAIVWDLEKGGLRVKMTSAIVLEADGLVRADGLQVHVGGRIVDVTPKPI
jgi:hypothetical protein